MDAITYIDGPGNEDWMKFNAWDLPRDTLGFLRAIAPMSPVAFLKLPAAQAMPAELRTSLGKLIPKLKPALARLRPPAPPKRDFKEALVNYLRDSSLRSDS